MAEFKNGAYEPGTYAKGDDTRVARTPSEAVDLVWKGFVRQDDSKPEAPSEETEKSETPAEPEGENVDTPVDPAPAEPVAEKRGPGRPRKPVVEDK